MTGRDEASRLGSGDAGGGSILFETADKSVVLLDIPRTLEESQGRPGQVPERRIYSAPPPLEPFPTPEPRRQRRGGRSGAAGAAHAASHQTPAARIADLMTAAVVRDALQRLADQYVGPFHLARRPAPLDPLGEDSQDDLAPLIVPPGAHPLHGSIEELRPCLLADAPTFDLVVLDPPWPNRSARRRADGYRTAATLPAMRRLLTSIPLAGRLGPDGLVAVWITNKPGIPDLLTGPSGVFASWGLDLAAEWIWVKVTASGEPLYDVDSQWRKPWEKLLVAKRRGVRAPAPLRSMVIVAAPDVHSRKPNLRGLFRHVLGKDGVGLEVFARNLTAGWWSWGDDVFRFQHESHWQPPEEVDDSQR
ncbi:hypothetical protein DCS_00347 [Drechmeria coniospora]|uniref:MT-A70 family n=1 Tax=Drechmeria coniospora TaxID=98403 RepID=A0A151GQ27_DRECN|nr:hypothetical protein DCS_00347 [Drechmeria coniospora]KYK59217.1 hypothetical protein DCS_00347 [Drechmeria coniospora]